MRRRRSREMVSGIVRIHWYPRAAAIHAREIPILPLVGSVMIPPGGNNPCDSASQIICQATRSLMLQPGLNISSLASTVASRPEATRFNSTIGVRPMSSVTSFAQWAIALHLSFSDQNGHDWTRYQPGYLYNSWNGN